MNKSKSSYQLLLAVITALFVIVSAQAYAFTPKEIYQGRFRSFSANRRRTLLKSLEVFP